VEIFDILGPHSQRSAPIDVKFCTAKRTQMPVRPAKFDLNWCNESPLRGEKPDFWPVSKNNTGSSPLRGNPAGNQFLLSCYIMTAYICVYCVYLPPDITTAESS